MARRGNPFDAAADRSAAPRAKPAARVRTDPIRVTLDLSPRQHRELKAWCNAAAVQAGLPTVALAPVLRILGDLLANGDPDAPGLQDPLQDAVKRGLERQATEAEQARSRRH
jgi:hypothetical protein